MHITLEEAVSLLTSWKEMGTVLRVYVSRGGPGRELHATIKDISGTSVSLAAAEEKIDFELSGAEFNGDRRSGTDSSQVAYLVCEYRNGDRVSLYATSPTPAHGDKPSTDRRRSP